MGVRCAASGKSCRRPAVSQAPAPRAQPPCSNHRSSQQWLPQPPFSHAAVSACEGLQHLPAADAPLSTSRCRQQTHGWVRRHSCCCCLRYVVPGQQRCCALPDTASPLAEPQTSPMQPNKTATALHMLPLNLACHLSSCPRRLQCHLPPVMLSLNMCPLVADLQILPIQVPPLEHHAASFFM